VSAADDSDGGFVRRRPMVIGLTGPIGCGKSTVAGWLADRGAAIVDADRFARGVTEPGEPALAAVVERFGSSVLRADGNLDRGALGRIVFADPQALADLEAIVHPAVRPRILDALRQAAAAGPTAIVLEAIRLVEAGYPALLDEVWLVTCAPDTQEERLVGRGMDPADARQRMRAQAGMADRLARAATRIIDTSGLPAVAQSRVNAAFSEALASHANRAP
jgi:dephospho-CoA kinase